MRTLILCTSESIYSLDFLMELRFLGAFMSFNKDITLIDSLMSSLGGENEVSKVLLALLTGDLYERSF